MIVKGRAHIGKMDATPTDSHLDARIKRCFMINVIVPKLEYAGLVWESNTKLVKKLDAGEVWEGNTKLVKELGAGEVWEGNTKLVKKLETVRMAAAQKVRGCSNTMRNTGLRAELGMRPL